MLPMKKIIYSLLFCTLSMMSHTQILESEVKSDHILLPRVTTTQRNLLSPEVGMIIYNMTIDCIEIYRSNGWWNNCLPTAAASAAIASGTDSFGNVYSVGDPVISFTHSNITSTLAIYGCSINVQKYGMFPSASAVQNRAALSAALAEAKATGRGIDIPGGTYDIDATGDIVVDFDRVHIRGCGLPILRLTDGSFRVSPSDPDLDGLRHQEQPTFEDLRFERIGTPGYAVEIIAPGPGKGRAVRFTWRNIVIDGSTGGGLRISGAILASFHGLWIAQTEDTGLRIVDPAPPQHVAAANALSFHGLEVVSAQNWGVRISAANSINFYGATIEGCREGGMWVEADCRNVSMFGGYFESNGNAGAQNNNYASGHPCDVKVGGSTPMAYGPVNTVFNSVYFTDGSPGSNHAIQVANDSRLTKFIDCTFVAYEYAPISPEDGANSTATGRAIRCVRMASVVGGSNLVTGNIVSGAPSGFIAHQDNN